MYRLAYSIPFPLLVFLVLASCGVWFVARDRLQAHRQKLWKGLQIILLTACAALFLCVSLLNRAGVPDQQRPPLFWSYKLAFSEKSYDYFQKIYLNILAFLLIGLFAAELFPSRLGKCAVICAGTMLSISVECIQYFFSLGLAEADDILSNILGIILGVLLNLYGYRLYKIAAQVVINGKTKVIDGIYTDLQPKRSAPKLL